METTNSLLKFNGRKIPYVNIEGTNYIAIRPVCDALGINYNRQYQNLKKDDILNGVFAIQQMRDPENRMRNYVALPEYFFFGWLYNVSSGSTALKEYKFQCYRALWNYFQGNGAERKKIMRQRAQVKAEIHEIKDQLKATNEQFQRLNQLQGEQLRLSNVLRKIDEEEQLKQLALFNG
jgi:hypothetical protein